MTTALIFINPWVALVIASSKKEDQSGVRTHLFIGGTKMRLLLPNGKELNKNFEQIITRSGWHYQTRDLQDAVDAIYKYQETLIKNKSPQEKRQALRHVRAALIRWKRNQEKEFNARARKVEKELRTELRREYQRQGLPYPAAGADPGALPDMNLLRPNGQNLNKSFEEIITRSGWHHQTRDLQDAVSAIEKYQKTIIKNRPIGQKRNAIRHVSAALRRWIKNQPKEFDARAKKVEEELREQLTQEYVGLGLPFYEEAFFIAGQLAHVIPDASRNDPQRLYEHLVLHTVPLSRPRMRARAPQMQYYMDVAMWYGFFRRDGNNNDNNAKQIMRRLFGTIFHAGIRYKRKGDDYNWYDWSETNIPVAAALSHGLRILIQLPPHAGDFRDWLNVGRQISSRLAATHGIRRRNYTADGIDRQVTESKTKGGAGDGKHYKLQLALGGIGNDHPYSTKKIKRSGNDGHLYINYCAPSSRHIPNRYGGLLVGVEGSSPGKSDHFGGAHGPSGKSGEFSPTCGLKWRDLRGGPQDPKIDPDGLPIKRPNNYCLSTMFVDLWNFAGIRESAENWNERDLINPPQQVQFGL